MRLPAKRRQQAAARRGREQPRGDLERARDSAMLQALFWFDMFDRSLPPGRSTKRALDRLVFHAAGLRAARSAIRLARLLNNGRLPQ